ncbi:hypothetical protein LPN01_09760 [Sphingomonas sp. A2-49]|uniref:hypothetical protein n=1 Tax=Sphingomonas sp. A2-49 TaxID=1391375 RepID=UPI0021CE36DC|nr:hypothetical protein [Sphingomonas sp. A2-49]MCU6454365.1 hypothetical protein [Sphingomonas sp. A2-49]
MKRMLASDGINYWSNQPFLNRMRAAGKMTSANAPAKAGEAVAYYLAPLVGDEGREMVLTWEGDGVLDIGVEKKAATRNRIDFTAATPASWPMVIVRSGKPTNIRIVPKGQEALTQTFKPEYVADVRGFVAWRAMDFLDTNASLADFLPIHPAAEGYGDRGSVAEVVELCNAAGVRPWISFPHLVTDASIAETVACVEAQSILPAIFEYSNETWNWQFVQTKYAHDQGPDNPNGWIGAQIARLLRATKGKRAGVAQCGQFVNMWHTDMQFQGIRDAGCDPNDLEIVSATSYVSSDFNDYGKNPDLAWGYAQRGDAKGALAYILAGIPKYREQMRDCVKRATSVGAEYWAYEGGMWHLNANGSAHDWETLRAFYYDMQMHPDADGVLAAYDEAFVAEGGAVQPLYNYATPSTAFGFFGATLQPVWKRIRAELDAAIAPVVTPAPMPAPAPLPDASPAPAPEPAPVPAAPTPAPPPAAAKVTKEQIYTAIRAARSSLSSVETLVKAYKGQAL